MTGTKRKVFEFFEIPKVSVTCPECYGILRRASVPPRSRGRIESTETCENDCGSFRVTVFPRTSRGVKVLVQKEGGA